MHGYSAIPQSGICDICNEEQVLGYMDCQSVHWCCPRCFLGMRNERGSEMTCHMCRSLVSVFVFPIKTENNEETQLVAIHAQGNHQ